MSNSVMPKGVEHCPLYRPPMSHLVSNSVMPKGVEHMSEADIGEHEWHVSNSVMPKGVEHASCNREVLTIGSWCRIQ